MYTTLNLFLANVIQKYLSKSDEKVILRRIFVQITFETRKKNKTQKHTLFCWLCVALSEEPATEVQRDSE